MLIPKIDYWDRKTVWVMMIPDGLIDRVVALCERFPLYRCLATAYLYIPSIHNLLQNLGTPEPRALAEGLPRLLIWRRCKGARVLRCPGPGGEHMVPHPIILGHVRVFQPTHNIVAIISTRPKLHHDLACAAVYRPYQSNLQVTFFQVHLADTYCIDPNIARLGR
jgi:hypothetical protein